MEKRACSFAGCDEPYSALGYCRGHYDQLRYGIELRPLRRHRSGCSIDDCPEPHRSLGWCKFHYGRWQRYGDPLATPTPRRRWSPGPCDFPGCTNVRGGKRWYCPPHARQLLRGEDLRPLPPRKTTRKYAIDHHFFDEIDTEEKAYWLGFITADGCIVSSNDLTINLQAADAGHLEKLSASLSSDYPVRLGPGSKSPRGNARWHANSIPVVSALGALGVTPRKSATATPWDGPADLMPHYWRGMVDGDGGMSTLRGRRSSPAIQRSLYLTGSRACVEAFAQWAGAICGSRAQPRLNGTSKTCWIWTVGGNRMTPLVVRELYDGCTVSLDRKQVLADAIFAMAPRS